MQSIQSIERIVAPLDRANVDTDAIIPKQYLKSIQRTGFGPHLFDHWRYLDQAEVHTPADQRSINPDFILNIPPYDRAGILLSRDNFGCGSSREHAVWALLDAGFQAVIACSFADIFRNNCIKNGLLTVALDPASIDLLFLALKDYPGLSVRIDLEEQTITLPDKRVLPFDIEATAKQRLLSGEDEIALTLKRAHNIRAYEQRRRNEAPWLFIPATGG